MTDHTLFSTPPDSTATTDHDAVSVGVRVAPSVPGRVIGLRWYCPTGWDGSAGPVTAHYYTQGGVRLEQRTLTTPVAGAWNTVLFHNPVFVDPGVPFVVAVHLPARTGGADYAYTGAALPVTVAPLAGQSGVFEYETVPTFPETDTAVWFGVDPLWQTPDIPAGWPDGATTGHLPLGAVLTDYAGPPDIPAGAYTAVRFPPVVGDFYRFATGSTFTGCLFQDGWIAAADGLQFTDCTVDGDTSWAGCSNVAMLRCDVRGTLSDLVHITADGAPNTDLEFTDCYLHDPRPVPPAHCDGVQVRGVDGLRLEHCTVDMGPWRLGSDGATILNDAVFLENVPEQGGNTDVTVNECYLNGGGYALTVGIGIRTVITNNLIGPDYAYAPAQILTGAAPLEVCGNALWPSGDPVPQLPDTNCGGASEPEPATDVVVQNRLVPPTGLVGERVRVEWVSTAGWWLGQQHQTAGPWEVTVTAGEDDTGRAVAEWSVPLPPSSAYETPGYYRVSQPRAGRGGPRLVHTIEVPDTGPVWLREVLIDPDPPGVDGASLPVVRVLQGSDDTIIVTGIKDAADAPLNVTGWPVVAQARTAAGSAVLLQQWSTGAGTITTAGDTVTLLVPGAMSDAWTWGTAVVHVEVTDPNTGQVGRVAQFRVSVDRRLIQ